MARLPVPLLINTPFHDHIFSSSSPHLVADLELAHSISLLHDLAHKLVSANEVRRALEMSAIEVQVAAAESRRGDFEDRVGRVLELGIWSVFHGNLCR